MSRRLALTLTLALLLGLASITLAAPAAQAGDGPRVRLVHAVPEAPAVDILIDGGLSASQLSYAESTEYLQLSAGDHTFSAQAEGATIAEAAFSLLPGQAITVMMMGTAEAPELLVFEDDLSPLAPGNIRLNAIHAANGIDAVDVILPDGSPVLQGLVYGQGSGGIDIPANTYPLAVTPAGSTVDQAIHPPTEYYLRAGMLYRLVVLGGTPDILLLEAPVNPSPEANSVQVRVAHAIPDAPEVDVYLDDALMIPHLKALEITRHFALPQGTYNVTVRPSGADSSVAPIISGTLDISDAALAGKAVTAIVAAKGAALELAVFTDDVSPLDAGNVRWRVINAVSGANLIAELDDGTTIPAGEHFADTAAAEASAGVYELLIASDGGGSVTDMMAYNGGTLYTFVVTGSTDSLSVIMAQTALNQQPGSIVSATAPAAETAGAESAPVAEATEETAPEVVIEETPAPTQAPPPPPQPAAAPTEGLIGLIINLNPGANLQLREYPRADARSLGLISGGTVVTVLGRAGEPDFEVIPALPAGEDIDPTANWLKIVYTTPEGGTITAWVIAQYVQITDKGEHVRLVEVDPLPSDVPGEVSGAAAAAPTTAPVEAEFYGVIFNLNPDARLNVRRTPDVLGEVLVSLPPGTIVEPTGILEDHTWVFLRYTAEDGGVISGWAATEFIQFVFRGNNYLPSEERITEFLQRSLLTITDPDVRGTVGAGVTSDAATPEQPQVRNQYVAVTVLDPGANLHLRRTPDAAAESLALIPDAALLIVIGRTADAEWLQVSYDNLDGWVSSPYVELSFNDRRVDVLDVPEVLP